MNQILVTGDEYSKKPKKTKAPKVPKEKKVLGINGIVIFYAICTIILGICMISGSVYAKEKINETVEANTKPTVDISRNDENNTVEINVKHIRGIKEIAYKWNDEDETTINGYNKTSLNETIDLIGGKNVLTVKITEENGQTVTYKKEFTVGNLPEIKLEAVANGVKVTVTSEDEIDYITYSWDNGEEQKVTVGDTKYEGTINTPKGQHILKIEAIDINNVKASKEQKVVGDTEPTLNITAANINGKLAFIIDAEDDEQITTIEITHNDGTKQVINVNSTTYHGEVEMTQGMKKLIVKVYNKNGLEAKAGRQCNNE